MKKLILKWLFGIDNVEKYMDLLNKCIGHNEECIHLIDEHIETLNSQKEDLNTIRKLVKICENHGINVDEEIKHIKL